jgi:preprotein translocase subunit Sec63
VFVTVEHVGRHHWRPHKAQPCYAAMFDTLLLPHNKLHHPEPLKNTILEPKILCLALRSTLEDTTGDHTRRNHATRQCLTRSCCRTTSYIIPNLSKTTILEPKILCLALRSTLEDTTGDHTRRNHATRQCLTRSCCRTTSYIIPNLSKTTILEPKILCLSLRSTLEDTTGDHTRRNHATRQCLTRSCCRTTSYIIPNLSKTQFSNQKFCVWHCGARWKTPLATTHGATMLRGNV